MLIKNVSFGDLKNALDKINTKYNGNIIFNRCDKEGDQQFRMTLRVKESKGLGARRGFEGRRLINACWHVHGDFFDALFKLAPNAVIVAGTRKITRDGGNWDDWNIGSVISPLNYSDACDCGKLSVKTKTIRQNDLSSECWSVQSWGLGYCKRCEFKNTANCGGKQIRKLGKNEKGVKIPLGAEVG